MIFGGYAELDNSQGSYWVWMKSDIVGGVAFLLATITVCILSRVEQPKVEFSFSTLSVFIAFVSFVTLLLTLVKKKFEYSAILIACLAILGGWITRGK